MLIAVLLKGTYRNIEDFLGMILNNIFSHCELYCLVIGDKDTCLKTQITA